MTLIAPTTEPLLYAVEVDGAVAYTGTTTIDQNTGVNPLLVLYYSADENALLGDVAGSGGDYNPLPDVGGLCEGGQMYGYNDGLVICRQAHTRTLYPPEETPALFVVYREEGGELEWIVGEQVNVGTRRNYDAVLYTCLRAHVTQSDWTPPATLGDLWSVVQPGTPDWTPGVYAIDVLVTHNSRVWKSLIDANGYEPGVVGTWRDQSDPPLWVAPAGAVGLWALNAIAEYSGQVWRCTAANNSFAPGVWGWVLV